MGLRRFGFCILGRKAAEQRKTERGTKMGNWIRSRYIIRHIYTHTKIMLGKLSAIL